MLSFAIAAQIAALVQGPCVDGETKPCNLTGCPVATSTCVAGIFRPCKCVGCNDNNVCTTDTYSSTQFKCVFTPVAAGAMSCSDGNACTTGDMCDGAGACKGAPKAVASDANECTVDSCDPATGNAVYRNVADGTQCNDQNACTGADACLSGQCRGTLSSSIDDHNVCTADTCSPSTGQITHTPTSVGSNCDDGNSCTSSSVCSTNGTCVAVASVPAKPPTSCAPPPGGIGAWVCNGAGACVGETPITRFCYDSRGNMTKKQVCPAGQSCPGSCP